MLHKNNKTFCTSLNKVFHVTENQNSVSIIRTVNQLSRICPEKLHFSFYCNTFFSIWEADCLHQNAITGNKASLSFPSAHPHSSRCDLWKMCFNTHPTSPSSSMRYAMTQLFFHCMSAIYKSQQTMWKKRNCFALSVEVFKCSYNWKGSTPCSEQKPKVETHKALSALVVELYVTVCVYFLYLLW